MTKLMYKSFLFLLYCYEIFASVDDRNYPRYHLAPQFGWMNDPNGFCEYKNEYHLFYQYNPHSSKEPGIAHWGHAKSKDLIHWEHLPIAMYPDKWYDKSGVFSGSAFVEDDRVYYYYTGNVNLQNESPDHRQYQALATSSDGVNLIKYESNPIINGTEYQPDIRDPKIWKHNNSYYMVLGNSFVDKESDSTRGRAFLYISKDLINWNFASVLDESDGSLGYMWECPDFFELDGRFVLLFSPQGIKSTGDKYRNLYQTGYIIGDFDYDTNIFTPKTDFIEMDHGHDFYATQTTLDRLDRRIVMAWLDMWDQNYREANDGWTGQMSIPRALTISKYNRILQKPVKEIISARGNSLYTGKARGGTIVTLEDKAGEINIIAPATKDLQLLVQSDNVSSTVVISYDYEKGRVSLNRGGDDGIRRTKWRPQGKLEWRLFLDASSIELFCGQGEITFSSRFFPDGPLKVRLGDESDVEEFKVYEMKRTVLRS